MDANPEIKQLKGVIRRRKKIFVVTSLLVFLLSGAIAFILPAIYRSQATILIEGQQIPEGYVKSNITGFVEERIDRITRRILSGTTLRGIIKEFNLYPAYPNPFNPSSKIRWQLAVGSLVNLVVYNLAGERVATLINERQAAGLHQVEFDGSALASGIYFYRLRVGKQVITRKMVLMK